MKKLLFLVALATSLFSTSSYAQDAQQQTQLSVLLSQYYAIKDALVAGNSTAAATSAQQAVKTLNSIDYRVVSEGNINALVKDVTAISELIDLQKQRGRFANFSNNMTVLAKSVKLSSDPIFQAYCPMKKAGWLSKDKEIRNPYFGSAMLSCGEVVQTIQ